MNNKEIENNPTHILTFAGGRQIKAVEGISFHGDNADVVYYAIVDGKPAMFQNFVVQLIKSDQKEN